MNKLDPADMVQFVEQNIGTFHQKRIQSLDSLKLSEVLKRKNPYLFRAKYVPTAKEIIRGIVDAHISSSEETIFGIWLKELVIFINGKVYGGKDPRITGIDFEFENDETHHIVAINSGPNWGNSEQIKKMISRFQDRTKVLRTGNPDLKIKAINGCCYGQGILDKGEYLKYCGQKFLELISGDKDLFIEIIEPLGRNAKEKNDDFMKSYCQMIDKFTKEFAKKYCDGSGEINWKKLLEFNSSAT